MNKSLDWRTYTKETSNKISEIADSLSKRLAFFSCSKSSLNSKDSIYLIQTSFTYQKYKWTYLFFRLILIKYVTKKLKKY